MRQLVGSSVKVDMVVQLCVQADQGSSKQGDVDPNIH